MKPRTSKVVGFIFKVTTDKNHLLFWFLIRFLSAILPLVTIYQFSQVIKQIETGDSLNNILISVIWIFIVRIFDNFLRLQSVTRLEYIIARIGFDIHNYFLAGLSSQNKEDRHASVQAIRNFADASCTTLNLIKQPGIDSLVSFLFIPPILFFVDFQVFIVSLAYISIYLFIDLYTTQHYSQLKDHLNYKTENYYAKLQDSADYDLEQRTWIRNFNRLAKWGFVEWSFLQNSAVFFYSLILLMLARSSIAGMTPVSHLVLVMGYVSQTQVFLNSFSSIQDSLTDTLVGLERLAGNRSVSSINLTDII